MASPRVDLGRERRRRVVALLLAAQWISIAVTKAASGQGWRLAVVCFASGAVTSAIAFWRSGARDRRGLSPSDDCALA